MTPFAIFVIIGIVIWAISAMSSIANKQQEAQRRQRFREMMEQSQAAQGGTFAQRPAIRPPPIPTPPRVNPGYAVRHPEMVRQLPPAPPRRAAQQQRRKPAPASRATAAPPPPIPVLEADDETPRRPAAKHEPTPQTTEIRQAAIASAPAIKRWLQPATLRQQFILTELFQPPLALREDRLG